MSYQEAMGQLGASIDNKLEELEVKHRTVDEQRELEMLPAQEVELLENGNRRSWYLSETINGVAFYTQRQAAKKPTSAAFDLFTRGSNLEID